MAIGITEEQEHLREAVRRFVDARIDPSVVRAALDAAAAPDDKIVLAAQGCPTQAIAVFDGDTKLV